MNRQQQRIMQGALNYALAEKSDPFAYNRAVSHYDCGISGFTHGGEDAFYTASPVSEERTVMTVAGTAEKYNVIVYREMKRP